MLTETSFKGRVVVLGYGTVAQCALPLLMGIAGLPAERYRVIDMLDRSDALAPLIAQGLEFRQLEIARDNFESVLGSCLEPGDLALNLTVGVDSTPVMAWCHGHGVLYVDTALEVWGDLIGNPSVPMAERTEYMSHERARARVRKEFRADGPTAIVTHGANPGIVNHFAKAAMLDLARHLGRDPGNPEGSQAWARLARDLGIKVIHISERDTQVIDRPKEVGEFVNTWSIEGFVEEAMMPSEMGWGSHEAQMPERGHGHNEGPANCIFIAKPAAEVLLRSWVPKGGQIAGFALPHAECITMSRFFTLKEEGRPLYRPTVAFVYMACDAAMASLHEMMMQGWKMPGRERVVADEVTGGIDELGILLLGDNGGWWYGSQLDIHEARRLVPGTNATAIQVAAGAVSATIWAATNPDRGYCEPEDLPHEEILAIARPWLGPMVSTPTDWSPLKQRADLFEEEWVVGDDPWQFANFRIG